MICPKCKKQLMDGVRFCKFCGMDLQKYTVNIELNSNSESSLYGKQRIYLPTNRGAAKLFFLGILTLGIYPTVIYDTIVQDLNFVARSYDGKRTMSYAFMLSISPFTLFIYMFYWFHTFSARLGEQLRIRKISYSFGASYFWIFNVLLGWTIVCPFIYAHMLTKSVNLINADYNHRGM